MQRKIYNLNSYKISFLIMMLAILIMVISTATYFGTNNAKESVIDYGKIQIEVGDSWTDAIEIKNTIANTKITNPIYFQKSVDSEDMFVRAKMNYVIDTDLTEYTAVEKDEIENFVHTLNKSLIYPTPIANAKWLEVGANKYAYLVDNDNTPIKITSYAPYLLSNSILIPKIEQLTNKLQYMLKLNLNIEIQSLQATTIPNTLDDVQNNFRTVFENYVPTNINYFTRIDDDVNHTTTITGLNPDYSTLTKINIPSTYINGVKKYSVTSIGTNAFKDNTTITNVDIPYTVTSLGSYAFSQCNSLTSITIPDSVISIDSYVFFGCTNLTSATIGNGVTNIVGLFYNCSGLTSITIGNNVSSIGNYAFYGCSGLTSITIGNNVSSIGNYAFYGCSDLTSIVIPNSVKSIGVQAFSGCNKLVQVRNLSGITLSDLPFSPDQETITNKYADFENELVEEGKYITYTVGTKKYLIEFIADVDKTSAIDIPDNITDIYQYAFYNCSDLISIVIPNSVKSIGVQAFSGCNKLVQVKNLSEITLSDLPTNPDMENKTNTDFTNTLNQENKYIIYTAGIKKYLMGFTAVADRTSANDIPSDITDIYQYAFYGCSKLTSIVIPNSVTSIGNQVFYGCSGLTNVTIPENLKTLGSYAFYNCNRITIINLPENVTNIGEHAFSYCRDLTSITIPNSVTSIGDYAFSQCNSLSSIVIPDNVESISSGTFFSCSKLTSIVIPNSVTSIGDYAFSQCNSLISITIPDSVTNIGNWAFSSCSELTSITIPNSVTSIGNHAFRDCSKLTSVTIGEGLISIGSSAFYNCSGLIKVYYLGSANEWTTLSSNIGRNNTSLTNADRYYIVFDGSNEIVITDKSEAIITPTSVNYDNSTESERVAIITFSNGDEVTATKTLEA